MTEYEPPRYLGEEAEPLVIVADGGSLVSRLAFRFYQVWAYLWMTHAPSVSNDYVRPVYEWVLEKLQGPLRRYSRDDAIYAQSYSSYCVLMEGEPCYYCGGVQSPEHYMEAGWFGLYYKALKGVHYPQRYEAARLRNANGNSQP